MTDSAGAKKIGRHQDSLRPLNLGAARHVQQCFDRKVSLCWWITLGAAPAPDGSGGRSARGHAQTSQRGTGPRHRLSSTPTALVAALIDALTPCRMIVDRLKTRRFPGRQS